MTSWSHLLLFVAMLIGFHSASVLAVPKHYPGTLSSATAPRATLPPNLKGTNVSLNSLATNIQSSRPDTEGVSFPPLVQRPSLLELTVFPLANL